MALPASESVPADFLLTGISAEAASCRLRERGREKRLGGTSATSPSSGTTSWRQSCLSSWMGSGSKGVAAHVEWQGF